MHELIFHFLNFDFNINKKTSISFRIFGNFCFCHELMRSPTDIKYHMYRKFLVFFFFAMSVLNSINISCVWHAPKLYSIVTPTPKTTTVQKKLQISQKLGINFNVNSADITRWNTKRLSNQSLTVVNTNILFCPIICKSC